MGNGFFFQSSGEQLYGFLHPAEGGPRETGVVFVHGAFEERQDAHLVVRDAASRLASQGFAALRFDLFGHGDSAGEFEDARLDRWVGDTVAACDELRRQSGCARLALVALRSGAAVAVRAARALDARGAAPGQLVLWQPVLSGRDYLYDVLRAQLAGEMVMHKRAGGSRDALVAQMQGGEPVNVSGYRLTAGLFNDLSGFDLAAELADCPSRTLLVDLVRNPGARGTAELAALSSALQPRAQLERVVEAQPVWAEGKLFYSRADQLYAATARFLNYPEG